MLLRDSSPLISPEIEDILGSLGNPSRFNLSSEQLSIEIEYLGFPQQVVSSIQLGRKREFQPTIHTLGDLISTPRENIEKLWNMGPVRTRQIAFRLNEFGINPA